jgi:hypothetical protein
LKIKLNQTQIEESRAEFERAMKSNFFGINYTLDDLGRYVDARVGNMWWAWLERHETLENQIKSK